MAEEKVFENKIKAFLKESGCYFFKYWGGGQFTKAGIPDIIACANGFFFGIEVKAQNGKASALQVHNLKEIDKSGGFGILLYPDQWEVFKAMINALNNGKTETMLECYEKLKERWNNE